MTVGKRGKERVLALVLTGDPEKVAQHGRRQGQIMLRLATGKTIVAAVILDAGRRFLR
jgi:hypothetical protein